MNKAYRVVWSKVRQCYVVVSETVKNNGKSPSVKAKRIAAAVTALSVLPIGGGIAYAAYDPVTNTETLTNQMVSGSRGNLAAGDLKSFDFPDRNLVINWTNNSRGDGSAIRDAEVNAKNITINADFKGNQWTDKGIISDNETIVKASGNIDIITNDDSVYSEGDGKITIEGFKNLNITSTGSGYGIVDNGGGIVVKGGAGSKVKIDTSQESGELDIRPAIGNSIWTGFGDEQLGKGISIEADDIQLISSEESIFAGQGKDGNKFTVDLNAKNIDIKGTVMGMGGEINLNADTDGIIKISSGDGESAGEESINLMTNFTTNSGSNLKINENSRGLVQILGKISVAGEGSSVLANMTEDGSYLNTKVDDFAGGEFTKDAIEVSENGLVNLNISGNNSYIRGDMLARNNGEININATGNDFTVSRSYTEKNGSLLKAKDSGSANVSIRGDNGKIEGNIQAVNKGTIQMDMSGNNMQVIGDMTVQAGMNDNIVKDDGSSITADFSGENAHMQGDIKAETSVSNIDVNFSGENGILEGDVQSTGTFITTLSKPDYKYDIYENNVVNLNLTGDNTSHKGNLKAEGNNTLNAVYAGRGSALTGDADNSGNMNLYFTNRSVMVGNMTNDKKVYEGKNSADIIKEVKGKLKAEFDENSGWSGNLTNKDGEAEIALKNGSSWQGDLEAAGGTSEINLGKNATWQGTATGNGDISLSDNSLWHLKGNSETNSAVLDGSSVISLAGEASKLETQQLGGSGATFIMDLKYDGDDVNSYRDGDNSDYLLAHGGDGGEYAVDMTSDSSVKGMQDGSKLYFATVESGSSAFTVNESIQLKDYKSIYNKNLLVKKEEDTGNTNYSGYDNWFLTPDSSVGPNGDIINPNGTVPGSAYNTAFALWRDDDTLLKRLGELRYNREKEGIWTRFINKGMERDGVHGFSGNYKTIQVGADKAKYTDDDGIWYYGAAIAHLWGNSDYTDGSGSQKSTDLSLYATNIRPQGHYLDLVARVGRIDSDYNTSYGDHGKFKNWGSSIGAEYGRKQVLNHGWAIEPQAQLTYNYLWGDDYTTGNGARVSQDNADSLIGRFGFVLSKEFSAAKDNTGRAYIKASVLHDFLGDTESRIYDDMTFTDKDGLGDTWYVIGLGTNIYFDDNKQFYFDAERSFNADIKVKYRFNAGLRFEF